MAEITLTCQYDGGQHVSAFGLLIGQYDYYVWDPTPDQSSGPVMAATLADLGYNGLFGAALPVDGLALFQTLFVSVGIYDGNHIIEAGSPEAAAIVDYIEGAGRVYLEGGDVWYYDPTIGGHDFNLAFGISAVADGTGDLSSVTGLADSPAEGLGFNYSGENAFIDHLAPVNGGVAMFRNDSPTYVCGVSRAIEDGPRTVGLSFEFGGLEDGIDRSSKQELMAAIMDFFLEVPTAIDDGAPPAAPGDLAAYPNPFNPRTTFGFDAPAAGRARLTVFDVNGRLVRTLVDERVDAGPHRAIWDARDDRGRALPCGVYFARVAGDTWSAERKVILIK